MQSSDMNLTKKDKILFVGPYPPPYSGPELGMKLFLESSLKENFTIHFVKTNFRKSNVNKGRMDFTMIKAFFIFIIKLLYCFIRFRPKLVYYPITATETGWIGRDIWCINLSKLFKAKVVIHLRAGHFKLNLREFHPSTKKIIKYTCNFVSIALVQAECLRDQFSALLPDKKIKVLYNAVETSEYTNEDIGTFDNNKILFMGHLTHAKGYCDAVKALPLVAAKFPDVEFCFAGTIRKGERNVFFDQIKGTPLIYEDPFKVHEDISTGKFAENYNYLGVVTGQNKLKILKEANIFILPSYSEGFSLAVLEAMAMGKPIICTPVGALREIIKDGGNGYFIEPGDFRGLAEKIILLMSNEELRGRFAKKNYRLVREHFSSQKVSNQLEAIFRSIL